MRERTRTEYTMINTAVGIGGYVLNTILGFVCRVVFTKCLSADYLGVNGLFTNILSMLSLAELGVGGAVVYALYKPLALHDEEKVAALVRFYAKAYRLIGMVVAALGLALLPFLHLIIREAPEIRESITLLYLINLFNTASTYFFSYRSSLIIASQRNYVVAGVNYAITILQSAIQIILLYATHNYIWYLLVQTVGIFLYNILVFVLCGRMFPYIRRKDIRGLEPEEKKSLFANVRDLMIYKVSGLLVHSTDNILITFFKGLSSTGLISNYNLLVSTLGTLMNLLFNGLTASVGNHNAIESDEKKYEMFSFLNLMNFWIFGWGAVGILLCSSDLVQLFFGDKYLMPWTIPAVLALNFFSVGLMNAVWTYKHTMGLFRQGRFIQFFTGILNVVYSVLLGQRWGVFGILIATFFARMCTNFWYDPYAVFRYGFKKPVRLYVFRLLQYLAVLAAAIGACWLLCRPIRDVTLLTVLLKLMICSAVPNLVFWLAFHRRSEMDKLADTLRFILQKIKQRCQ